LRHYEPIFVEISLFERGWVILNENFMGNRRPPPPPAKFGVRKLESMTCRMLKKKLPRISTG